MPKQRAAMTLRMLHLLVASSYPHEVFHRRYSIDKRCAATRFCRHSAPEEAPTPNERKRMTVIDVHTHMLSEAWIQLIKDHGAPRYGVQPSKDGPRAIFWDGAPFMTPQEGHLDYELRI